MTLKMYGCVSYSDTHPIKEGVKNLEKIKLTREQYRKFKCMNHKQMEEFVTSMYNEAYETGRKAADPKVKMSDIAVAITEVRGIDTQKASEIMSAINILYDCKKKNMD